MQKASRAFAKEIESGRWDPLSWERKKYRAVCVLLADVRGFVPLS
jgi:hypothetical protein